MTFMGNDTVTELRKQFNNLVDVLESDGFCTSRDCMCDHSAPIVKMEAELTRLETYFETVNAQEGRESKAAV